MSNREAVEPDYYEMSHEDLGVTLHIEVTFDKVKPMVLPTEVEKSNAIQRAFYRVHTDLGIIALNYRDHLRANITVNGVDP